MLPLTIFEKYMFFDDRPEYPMDSFRLLRFSGKLDIEQFSESIRRSVSVHPFLRSIVVPSGSTFVWNEVNVSVDIRIVDELVPERLDITKSPGFRVYIHQNTFLFQFHHCVSDGLGEMEFLGDVMQDYSNVQVQKNRLKTYDASLLPLRGSSGLTYSSYVRNFLHTMFTTYQLCIAVPSPLLPVSQENTQPVRDYYQFLTYELSADKTKQCFAEAKKNGVTVNDYLVAAVFKAMRDFNRDKQQNPLYRVSIPYNLRTEKMDNIPASNTVTMVFLDRRHKKCADFSQLLHNVHQEMQWIRRTQQYHYLLLTLRNRDLMPGGIAMTLKPWTCRSTIVVSNLGRIFDTLNLPRTEDGKIKAGEAVLEEVNASPPIRPGTLISFSVLTYANHLRFILRYDSQNMMKEQADEFLRLFVAAAT